MASPHRIDLAHQPSFVLGRLTVMPPYRELVRDDGVREVLEHRVMQVLIALATSGGDIVTRDDLTMSCWEGRIVGEDAINRVISRLRKAADGIGDGSFRIDTITKVGYRLIGPEGASANQLAGVPPAAATPGSAPTRRAVLAGAAVAGMAALGGGAALYRNLTGTSASPEMDALLTQAWTAWAQGTSEGNLQAIGLYRRAIAAAPDHADAWGFLACAYGDRAHYWSSGVERPTLRQRARTAGQRAMSIDPKNALGRGAIAYAQPMMGRWLAMEREFIGALEDQPDKWLMTYNIALSFMRVGRLAEAAKLFAAVGATAPTAMQYSQHARALWGSGQIEEAERVLQEAESIYATHPLVWFTRFEMLVEGGSAGAVIALTENIDSWPAGISEQDLAQPLAVARARMSGDPVAIDAIIAEQRRRARESAPMAVFAIQIASIFGRIDDAMTFADAYYFSRGFAIPDRKPIAGQPSEVTLDTRDTRCLFIPCLQPMRNDVRFSRLTEELGLERYWREADVRPDFRRT